MELHGLDFFFPVLNSVVNVVVPESAIAEFSLPSREDKAHALSLLTTSRYDAGSYTVLPQCLFVV